MGAGVSAAVLDGLTGLARASVAVASVALGQQQADEPVGDPNEEELRVVDKTKEAPTRMEVRAQSSRHVFVGSVFKSIIGG